MQFVIPGLTRNPGLPAFGGARGDQGFFWIPAVRRAHGFEPVEGLSQE